MVDSLRYIEIQLKIYIENEGILTQSIKVGLLYSCKELDIIRYEVQNDYKISLDKDAENQNELELMADKLKNITEKCNNIVCTLAGEVCDRKLSVHSAEGCCKIIRQVRGIYIMKLYIMLKKFHYVVGRKVD